LRAYIEANIEYLDSHRKEAIAIGEIVLNVRDENGRLRCGRHTDGPVLQPLIELLEAGQRAGEFTDFDPRVMAQAIRHAIDGAPGDLVHGDVDGSTLGRELADLFDRATRATGEQERA